MACLEGTWQHYTVASPHLNIINGFIGVWEDSCAFWVNHDMCMLMYGLDMIISQRVTALVSRKIEPCVNTYLLGHSECNCKFFKVKKRFNNLKKKSHLDIIQRHFSLIWLQRLFKRKTNNANFWINYS
jgi:hypothetical protein